MRWKLIRRRLTISAPSMTVRSSIPWPLRCAGVAMMVGFFAAIGLGAFQLGKNLAGVDTTRQEELAQLKTAVAQLQSERDKAQSIVNTSGSLLTAERSAQERLAMQVRQLETENRKLRDDFGFFERLMPAGTGEPVAIRSLQAEVLAGSQMRWQILVMQAGRNAPEFRGQLQLSQAVVKNVSARVVEGTATRAVQSVKLGA